MLLLFKSYCKSKSQRIDNDGSLRQHFVGMDVTSALAC